MIEIENALGELKTDVTHKVVMLDNKPDLFIFETIIVKGTFLENLELYDFPVDVQDLTITISTSRAQFELEFFEDENSMSTINTQVFIDHQEWKLYDHVEVTKRLTSRNFIKGKLSTMSFTCHAGRRYFQSNTLFVFI